jgi:hypothetical protein
MQPTAVPESSAHPGPHPEEYPASHPHTPPHPQAGPDGPPALNGSVGLGAGTGHPVPGTRRPLGEIALLALDIAIAYAEAGVHEEGGNNRGDYPEFFQRLMGGHPGDPWCADFVCTCLVKAYARHAGQAEDRAHLPGYVHAASAMAIPLSGYCPALAEGARQKFLFRSPSFTPAPGDLVLFDFSRVSLPVRVAGTGEGEPHHVGFVREARPDGSLWTVEGNTSSGRVPPTGGGSQRDGDGVYCRTRPRTHVFGFVHLG